MTPGLTSSRRFQNGTFCLDQLDELGPLRPGPDDAHVPGEDVPELRELVEVRAAEDSPDGRDAGIVVAREGRAVALGIAAHRPELVDREPSPALAEPRLAVEDGPAAELGRKRHQRDHRCRKDEQDEGDCDVEGALRPPRVHALLGMQEAHEPGRGYLVDWHPPERELEEALEARDAHVRARVEEPIERRPIGGLVGEHDDVRPLRLDDLRQLLGPRDRGHDVVAGTGARPELLGEQLLRVLGPDEQDAAPAGEDPVDQPLPRRNRAEHGETTGHEHPEGDVLPGDRSS